MSHNPFAVQFELKPGAQIVEFDSSTHGKSYRVELADGRHFQINAKLHQLLEALRTPLTLPALADAFHARSGQQIALEQLTQLNSQLVEQGVVIASGSPVEQTVNSQSPSAYLGLHYRRDLLSPALLAPLARLLQICFNRSVALVLMVLIVGAHLLAYREIGFPPRVTMEGVSWPLFYGLFLLSILLHELGHLAACHRWNCPHGPLGVGLYFFYPVFYVDVTAAWRLNRYQRAVVDVGGVYLQLLCVPLALALYWLTQDATYLMLIAVIDLVILGNFEPFMKLDGYWLLSDLTGVPNLHARTSEAAKRMWGWLLWRLGRRTVAPPASAFSQWTGFVRVVIFVYIGLSIVLWPLLILGMVPMLIDAALTYPALWQSAIADLVQASAQGDMGGMLTQLNILFMPTLTLLTPALLLKISWTRLRKKRQTPAPATPQLQPA